MIKRALTIFLMPNMVHIDLYQIIKTTDGYDAELSIAAGYQPTNQPIGQLREQGAPAFIS